MPKKLYKYRPFDVRALRSLTEAEVHYAQPRTFNDPLDCDPTFDVDVGRVTLEKLYYRMLLRRMEKAKAAEKVGYLRYMSTEHGDYQTDKDVEGYLVQMLAREIKDELDDEFAQRGVLSLSATWASVLMWSHYADEHRGICVEYDTTDQEHPTLGPVNYRAARAVKASDLVGWKGRGDETAKKRVILTYFYAKSAEWKYEKEWRDVRDENGVRERPFRITAIHFGLRCDVAVITSMVRLLHDQPQIKLYGIRPKEETFKLRRSLIDRGEIDAVAISEPGWFIFKDVVWDDNIDELPEAGDEVLPNVPEVPNIAAGSHE
ncbi:MAG: hypothetical protein JWM33_2770 [Caulobacteraceae bacterium]|nr:hypothetical protein [Caulobacteraceae bacterium]